VALLAHPGAWWRTTAQRLLLERQDRGTGGLLARFLRTTAEPRARVHAAWLLHRLGALDEDLTLRLLRDPHPRVREQGVRLAEGRLAKSAAVRKAVLALADDRDARLRFQVALSLGEWEDDAVVGPLARIALAGAADHWTRLAVASAVPRRTGLLIAVLCR